MNYRRLGMWGVQLSEIGYGSWLVFNDNDEQRAKDLHRTAYEQGINFYDTANVYNNTRTEILVGKAMQPFARDTYVLATKLYWPLGDYPFPANNGGLSRKHIFEQCHASLKRLQTDYIDLYQCHRYDEHTPLIETCRAMNDLINQGKVLYWGVSEWNATQIADAVSLCEDNGWHPPVSNQPQYNMLQRHWEKDVFPLCAELGLGLVAFSPLAQGMLTGKYLDGIPAGSRGAHEKYSKFITELMTDQNMKTVRKLNDIADGLGVPLATLALAWCLRRSEMTSAIIGASKPEQIEENVKAADLKFDDDVRDRIRAILG